MLVVNSFFFGQICMNAQGILHPGSWLCPTNPTPLEFALHQWGQIYRWLAFFCDFSEANARPEVLTGQFTCTHTCTLSECCSPPPHFFQTFNGGGRFFYSFESLEPLFFLFGLLKCGGGNSANDWLWGPERGKELITPLQLSAWNWKVTVETAVFSWVQRCFCLYISHSESALCLKSEGQARLLSHVEASLILCLGGMLTVV